METVTIAISYRRDDSSPVTGRLYDHLQAKFGPQNVFMDIDSIRPGVDFREQINDTICRADAVVAVIGRRWLGEQPDGSRRIDDPNDFVRLEIASALKCNIPVIPVLVDDAPMPKQTKLPPDIEPLAYRQALPLDSGLDFHQHTERLISGICESLNVDALGKTKRHVEPAPRRSDRREQFLTQRKIRRRKVAIWLSSLGLVAAIGLFFVSYRSTLKKSTSLFDVSSTAAEKSIAVLPFENLSDEKQNAYFADGVQDEILTNLSKIAELKVISRTSVMPYKTGVARNLREIARQLRVAHLVEGSVQRVANRVRVNAQLIDARSDAHLWAQTYDRDLADVFAIQSEIAKAIADQLRAKLTGEEEQVIFTKPTDNPDAYDAYLRGLAYSLKTQETPENSLSAQRYLKQAVQLDPKFALAWARLAYVDASGYLTTTLQPTTALREEARQAAETAFAVQPDLGEAVLAKGYYHYACVNDYDTALRYFEQARRLLPNNSLIPEYLAYVARRQGHWDQSEGYFNEAERLDPRNPNLLGEHALQYIMLRCFPKASRKLDDVLNVTPDDPDILGLKATVAQADGDLTQAAAILAPLQVARDDTGLIETQIYQAILERKPAPAIARLREIFAVPDPALAFELRFFLGWAQEVAGDHTAAQQTWRHALAESEVTLKQQPDNNRLVRDLALINAGLGNKAAAFACAERAMAVMPVEKDAIFGPAGIEILARVAAQTGEPDRAIVALQKALSLPYVGPLTGVPLTPPLLRLDPMFDPIRNDPRFATLIADHEK
jgi:TolB-like protein/Tfp pilus assembly protein PilF